MEGVYDDNLPPQLANDSSFNNEREVKCKNCNGEGYTIEYGTTIGCCGNCNEDGSCCGNGIPIPEPYQQHCNKCDGYGTIII